MKLINLFDKEYEKETLSGEEFLFNSYYTFITNVGYVNYEEFIKQDAEIAIKTLQRLQKDAEEQSRKIPKKRGAR